MRMPPTTRRSTGILGAALVWLAVPGAAWAQGAHPTHAETDKGLIVAGIAHGTVQGSAAFLAGLAVFTALVWLPASRDSVARRDADRLFGRAAWVLFGLLLVAGSAELSLYAVRASGEPLSLGLLRQALLETRVGGVWLDPGWGSPS